MFGREEFAFPYVSWQPGPARRGFGPLGLRKQIKDSEHNRQIIKRKIAALKRQILERESELIFHTLNMERAQESLRIQGETTYVFELTDRDEEIDGFRDRHPEWCQKVDDGTETGD